MPNHFIIYRYMESKTVLWVAVAAQNLQLKWTPQIVNTVPHLVQSEVTCLGGFGCERSFDNKPLPESVYC